jgi:hypothetical protein
MENKVTIDQLIKISKNEWTYKESNTAMLKAVVYTLNNHKWFREYLYNSLFNYYELPTIVFWEAAMYVKQEFLDKKYLLKCWADVLALSSLLSIMNTFITSPDDQIRWLVVIWFLESLIIDVSTDQEFKNIIDILKFDSLKVELNKFLKWSNYE